MRLDLKIRISLLLLALLFAPCREANSADVHRSLPTATPGKVLSSPRAPSLVERQEIFQAIQKDLALMGVARRAELQPGDLIIQCSVPALKGGMGLEVKRMGFDPIRRVIVFELWASLEPQYLPFEVTTRRDPRSWGLTPPPEWNGANATESRGLQQRRVTAGSKAPVLAKPGRSATLVMLGKNVRITTTVVPLQPGIKGQCILVRDPATARVMTAEVVDEGLLETSF